MSAGFADLKSVSLCRGEEVLRASVYLSAALTSLLMLRLSYPPIHLGWLAWAALAPITIVTVASTSTHRALVLSFPVGIAWTLVTVDWVRTAYTSSNSQDWQAMWSAWLVLGLIGGFCFACFSTGHWLLSHNLKWPSAMALPLAWGVSEELMDSICRALAGTTSDTMRLALTQTNCAIVVQSADLGGTLAVGWVVASINGCVVDLARAVTRQLPPCRVRRRGILVSLVLIGLMLSYGRCRCEAAFGQTVRVGVVPLNLTQESARGLSQEIRESDFIVWPEHAWNETIGDVNRTRASEPLREVVRSIGRPVLVGVDRLVSDPPALYNSVGLYSPSGVFLESSDKRFLGPVNEAMPPLARWLIPSQTIAQMPYASSRRSRALSLPCGSRVGIGVCHDVCYPEWSRDLCRTGDVDLLVSCASEGFDGTGRAARFTLACAQLRAVESRRATVRCVRRGISAIIDGSGRVLIRRTNHPFVADVPLDVRWSLFVTHGATPFVAGVSLTVLLSCGVRRAY